jgi:hypothetical protein
MEEESVGQRFSQLIQQLGMSKNAFAMSLDKTATVIQHLVDERNKPGFDLMCKVFEVYPNVSRDWLLMGKGPMLLSNASATAPVPPVDEPALAVLAAVAKPPAVPATPHFPEPLFTVSAARPPIVETPALPAAPLGTPTQETVAASQPMSTPVIGAVPAETHSITPPPPVPSTSPAAPVAPAASLDATALTAALHAQYLQHQLALAEQRNQHLLEQQQLMQQMLELMRQSR